MSALPQIGYAIGTGLLVYGLSPLSGSGLGEGLTERGCLAAIAGVVVIVVTTIFKVVL